MEVYSGNNTKTEGERAVTSYLPLEALAAKYFIHCQAGHLRLGTTNITWFGIGLLNDVVNAVIMQPAERDEARYNGVYNLVVISLLVLVPGPRSEEPVM